MKPQEIVIRVVVDQTQPAPPASADEFVEIEGKKYTPSQRLRFALRRRWLEKGAEGEFEPWYEHEIDRIIRVIEPKTKR